MREVSEGTWLSAVIQCRRRRRRAVLLLMTSLQFCVLRLNNAPDAATAAWTSTSSVH